MKAEEEAAAEVPLQVNLDEDCDAEEVELSIARRRILAARKSNKATPSEQNPYSK